MGPRVRKQHLQIIWGSVSQSLQPLLDPTQCTTQSGSSILLGPLRMFTGQAAKGGPVCDPFDFHVEPHLRIFPQCDACEASEATYHPFFLVLSIPITVCLLEHDEGKPGDEGGK